MCVKYSLLIYNTLMFFMTIVILLLTCFLKGPVDLFLTVLSVFLPIVTMPFVIEHDDDDDDDDD